MVGKPRLNPEILDLLHKSLNKSKATIRSDISRLRRKFPGVPLNAVAQIYAEQHGLSVRRLVPMEERAAIPSVQMAPTTIVKKKRSAGKELAAKTLIMLDTNDVLLRKHVTEINRAYNKGCYTCVFVLTRKIFENLIVNILRREFPNDPTLYFDVTKGRNLDFSVVLTNLYKKRAAFAGERAKAIERLNQTMKAFKSDANDKAHSLFHIVESSKEVDDWHLDTTMAILAKLM